MLAMAGRLPRFYRLIVRIAENPATQGFLERFYDTGFAAQNTRITRLGRKDRFKALCGVVLGDKIRSLILSFRTLHIGPDA